MINFRMRCLPEEVDDAKRALEKGFKVDKIRGPYADKYPQRTVRTYINVTTKDVNKIKKILPEEVKQAFEKSKKEGLI